MVLTSLDGTVLMQHRHFLDVYHEAADVARVTNCPMRGRLSR